MSSVLAARDPSREQATRAWWMALALLGATWAAIVALLYPSAASMVSIWDRSETYTHGYVILPIALWLVWRKRASVLALPAAGDFRALLLVAAIGMAWLAARVAGIQVGEHYTLVALLMTSVWALLGWGLVSALFFPIAYLLFMVPSGEGLTAPLIDFTADFTVFSLRALGFPVYREGTFFSIPSGDWSVVEACSGVRYFLSSLVLGWLYAYLTYRTWWKRLAFGLAAVIVPIFANGFRAVLIVLIAHYSDMTLALGVDHFIYGWVWFGIVMLALFWFGNHWREDHLVTETPASPETPHGRIATPRPAWRMALVVVTLVAVFPWYERHLSNRPPSPSPLAGLAPASGWQAMELPFTGWTPRWIGMDDQRALFLGKDVRSVMLYVAWYGTQRQGSELINSQNVLVPEKHDLWRKTAESGRTVGLPEGDSLPVREALVDSGPLGQRLLVWYWNRIEGQTTTSGIRAKLWLAWRKLSGQSDAGAVVIVAAPYGDKPAEAEPALLRAASELTAGLHRTLDEGMR
ncbi:MAG TPA: exosortase A [Thiobacillaceae bacterium]|nr:exosortase A [Thiobacillaceae bacterium]